MFLEAKSELAELHEQYVHAASKRDRAAPELLLVVRGVIASVCGDPAETQNGELYAAMGYVPKNQRASGRARAGAPRRSVDGRRR